MNSLRTAKKSKRILKKMTCQQQTPEQQAKQKLIELSNMWDYNQNQTNFDNNPEIILEEPKGKSQTYHGRKPFNTERTRVDVSGDFKKLTELFEEKPDIDRLEIRSERHYKYGDKFISIALRNPLTTSNYIMTGINPPRNSSSNPQRSQYILRQQRNSSRIRREQHRRKVDSMALEKAEDECFYQSNKNSIKFEATKLVLNNLLKSGQFLCHENKFSQRLKQQRANKTTQFFRQKK